MAIVLNKLLHLNLPMLFVLFHLSFLFMGNTLRLAITQNNGTAKKISFYLFLQVLLTIPLVTGCFFAVPEVTAAKFVMYRAEGNALGYFLAIFLFIVSVNYKFNMGQLWVWLGVVSYSLYLMHLLCLDFLLLVIPVDTLFGAVSYVTLGLLTACLLAKLAYVFVEHPAIELGKKVIHSRKIAEPI